MKERYEVRVQWCPDGVEYTKWFRSWAQALAYAEEHAQCWRTSIWVWGSAQVPVGTAWRAY